METRRRLSQSVAGAILVAAVAAAAGPRHHLPKNWALIPTKGKSFTMGQEYSGRHWTFTYPAHTVSFTYNFAMCKTQVTQAEYLQVMGANPTLHPGDLQRPIDDVTWFDAVYYCNALSLRDHLDPVYSYTAMVGDPKTQITNLEGLTYDIKKNGYRLLTSAEYEFVTREGTTTTWFFGDSDDDQDKTKDYAWSNRNATTDPHPVGTLKPRGYGVYDINGNLWMWCDDWYDEGPYPSTPQIDQTGPATGTEKIARGGAWKNDVYHQRSAYHWQWSPDTHNYEVGFRIARTM